MRAFGFLILILLIIFVAGIFLGWFTVSASSRDGSRPNVHITVDKEKMQDDVASVKDKVTSAVSEKTVSGTIRRVETAARELVVSDSERRDITVRVTSSTDIRIGDRSVTIDEIRADDPVSVVYEERKDEKVARRISVPRRS